MIRRHEEPRRMDRPDLGDRRESATAIGAFMIIRRESVLDAGYRLREEPRVLEPEGKHDFQNFSPQVFHLMDSPL